MKLMKALGAICIGVSAVMAYMGINIPFAVGFLAAGLYLLFSPPKQIDKVT